MQDLSRRAPCAPGDAALRAMFAARKEVFIDLLKWDLSALAGAYELDQYDDPVAEYLILLDTEGGHRASARLLRTDGPHLLGDHYAHLCDEEAPRGSSVREITRFCLDRNQSAAERRSARDQLVTALAEHALRLGISEYIGVAELRWLNQIQEFGWNCAPLGATVLQAGKTLAAFRIRIDEQTLPALKRNGIFAPTSLHLTTGTKERA